MKMVRLMELILFWITAIILPAKIYIILIGAFIFINLFLKLIIKYNKKTKVLNKIDVVDILMTSIKDIAIYASAIVGIYWLDVSILNDVFLTFLPSINLFATKFTTVLFLSPEIITLNRSIKILTSTSLIERFKQLIKFIFSIKDIYKKIQE